jgi:hypothetical protein
MELTPVELALNSREKAQIVTKRVVANAKLW